MKATRPQSNHEHEFEPQFGLPERLPEGETILWQGVPDWRDLARRVFHVRAVAAYFGLMLAWRVASTLSDGGDAGAALASLTWLVPLFATGLGLLLVLAWLTARTTVYTLTDRRIVMRIGIVLTVTYNLPLTRIERADLREGGGGPGDIALVLEAPVRIAWLHLWPHVRPWRVAHPSPMLRSIPDATAVAAQLRRAWSAANGAAPHPDRGVDGIRPSLTPVRVASRA
ncbi:MAG: PH domain-containing protein [Burkholderiales bacterium]|jgi:hypothetical protein|nr:PH domain-containing protein [Burkholderiales bacterium]